MRNNNRRSDFLSRTNAPAVTGTAQTSKPNAKFASQTGLTLIELIVSMVIISISLVAVMSVISSSTASSANPMIRQQGLAIANAYMEEILPLNYVDPHGSDSGSCEEGAANRALFDDVNDYDCINDTNGAIDQNGTAIAGLEGYNIQVNVGSDSLNGATAQRIDVLVTHDALSGINIGITSFRINY